MISQLKVQRLRKEHNYARAEFEAACLADYISLEDYESVRKRYHETMKAYHDALGYGGAVGGSRDAS